MEYNEIDEEVKSPDETPVEEQHEDARTDDAENIEVKYEDVEQEEVDLEKEAREEAERRERREEVKTWLTSEEHSRKKARIEKVKARAKKDILQGGLVSKKKRNEQKNPSEQEMLASELISQFDQILQSSEKKLNDAQNILNNHENDKKEIDILVRAACQGKIENDFVSFLNTQYDNKNDLQITKNLTESISLINTTTKLEDLLLDSIQRQLNVRRLVTEFAKDFAKENFQPDEKITVKKVDEKIREQKRQRDFYDCLTVLTYQNLMAELAYRIAIIVAALKSFSAYKNLLEFPLDYSRYETIDKNILSNYVGIFDLIWVELALFHDDDCPDDADENLKAAYQLNNEMAEFYEKIKTHVSVIAEKMNALNHFLAEKENYAENNKDALKELIESIKQAGEAFDAALILDKNKNLKNFIRTDTEAIVRDVMNIGPDNTVSKTLMVLSIGEMRIIDLMRNYNSAKKQDKDLLWKALESKEKYLPDVQALIMALINLYQLENDRQEMMTVGMMWVARETVERDYRRCMGLFEIVFRNLTSIATYIYNAISHQSTDIAADGPDGELVRTVGLASGVLKGICRVCLDEYHMDLLIFTYQRLLAEPKSEEYLYYAEVKNQVILMMRKYLPVALMPNLFESSEAMTKVSAILNKYDDLNLPPSGMRDAMTEEDKKEMGKLIGEARAEINHYMSWHTDNGIGTIYSLYDFTIYSPETLIKRAKAKELVMTYLATAEDNTQAKRLMDEEKKIKDEMAMLPKTDKVIYSRLNECAGSYEVMLRMFRQFYTLFNQRNTNVLKTLRENEKEEDFDKKIMICDEKQAPQIKNVLVNFVRSYVRFSKQYVMLVQEYINSTRALYQGLPDFDKNVYKCLKCADDLFPSVQGILIKIRTSLKIIQSDQDPMIAKFMKTMLSGMEKSWVGDLDLEAVAAVSSGINKIAEKSTALKEAKIDNTEIEGLLMTLEYNAEPLVKWVKEIQEAEDKKESPIDEKQKTNSQTEDKTETKEKQDKETKKSQKAETKTETKK